VIFMTILKTDKQKLEKLIGTKFTIDELASDLFDFGMELDSYENNDLYIDITADRPDLLSSFTLAGALRNYKDINKNKKSISIKDSGVNIYVDKSVDSVRPFISAFVVKNIKIDSFLLKDIINVQEKLHETFCRNRKVAAIGIYPLKKIKTPIYYIAKIPNDINFKPLNAERIMNAVEILEKHDTGIKYAPLLKNKDKYPVLLDSNNNILSMPPIINSADIGKVEEGTSEIFVEITGIIKSRVDQLTNILVKMFDEIGSDIYSVKVDYKNHVEVTPNLSERRVSVGYDYISKVLGVQFKKSELKRLLKRMDYKVSNENKDHIEVFVPYYRADVLHPIDIVDDIARAYKFNNFEPELPKLATAAGFLPKTKVIRFIRDLFIGMNFSEAVTVSLTNRKYQYEYMNIDDKEWIKIPNSKAGEIDAVRTWILPELLRAIKANEGFGIPIKMFELNDSCAVDERTETGYKNVSKLVAAIMNQKVTFTDIKQVADTVLKALNIKYKIEECNHGSFIEGRVGNIIIDMNGVKRNIGLIGEISPVVLENFGFRYPIAAFELNLSSIIEKE